MDIDREAARVTEQVDRVADQARRQFERVGPVVGRAESPDGAVRVQVAPGGLLTDVRLTRAALRGGAEGIAKQIVELAGRATRRAGDRMYHTMAPVLGRGGEQHLRSLGFEPLPDDDEDAAPLSGYHGR
jgi:hypothetical protein